MLLLFTNSKPSTLKNNNINDPLQIDKILHDLYMSPLEDGYADLSGGTNSSPSREGDTYKTELINKGWTVITN
ncbi:MAG: hypothetical protein KA792_08965 [Bacteroidales bacterium]|nr:hypothetical protein [Bacteroidales bacterium]